MVIRQLFFNIDNFDSTTNYLTKISTDSQFVDFVRHALSQNINLWCMETQPFTNVSELFELLHFGFVPLSWQPGIKETRGDTSILQRATDSCTKGYFTSFFTFEGLR